MRTLHIIVFQIGTNLQSIDVKQEGKDEELDTYLAA